MSTVEETAETEAIPKPPKRTIRRMEVREYITADQIAKDLNYSLADLSNAMIEQASMLAHYGVILAKSSRQVDQMKLARDIYEAKVYQRLKSLDPKATDVGLRRQLAMDSQVIEFHRAVIAAEEIETVAKHAVESFKHRRDMLIQHGLQQREELKGEVAVHRRELVEAEQKLQVTRLKEGLSAHSR